jgi:hypothetical protein
MTEDSQWLSQLAAVGAVLLLLFGAIALLRKRGFSIPMGAIRRAADNTDLNVLSRRALTGQHVLFLVEVRGEPVLVCTHPSGCTVSRSGPSFAHSLGEYLKREEGVRPQ